MTNLKLLMTSLVAMVTLIPGSHESLPQYPTHSLYSKNSDRACMEKLLEEKAWVTAGVSFRAKLVAQERALKEVTQHPKKHHCFKK